ncbi:hypothetical protein T439DRAFT_179434 [Meredithblackwellia eburnea MCA 4105]
MTRPAWNREQAEQKKKLQREQSTKATATSSIEEQLKKAYRSLYDQLDRQFYQNALKTCAKILRLSPADPLALQTRLQLLVALERYPDALKELSKSEIEGQDGIEKAYCLSKTGRIDEAAAVIEGFPEETREDTVGRLIEAQVRYRQGQYQASHELYEELVHTVAVDDPSLPDLETNLETTQSHLDFLTSVVPSQIAGVSVDTLEDKPLGPIVSKVSAAKNKKGKGKAVPTRSKATPSTLKSAKKIRAKGKKLVPLLKAGKPLPKKAEELDPERWVPKRERPGFAEEIVRRREKERGRFKESQGLTQGSAEPAAGQGSKQPSTPAKSGGGGGGKSGGGKKKKGKK